MGRKGEMVRPKMQRILSVRENGGVPERKGKDWEGPAQE